MKRLLLAALLLASCDRSGGSPDLRISSAWARAMVPGQSATAAYMRIANEGSAPDRLVGVDAPAPAVAMVHGTSNEGGIARMRPMDSGLEIPARATAQLVPGGTHVMITGLQSPLRAGDTLRLTLRFDRSGARSVEVPVRSGL